MPDYKWAYHLLCSKDLTSNENNLSLQLALVLPHGALSGILLVCIIGFSLSILSL